MAFIVEDGSVVSGANAYVTVAEYQAYFADRANYTAENGEIEPAIVRGTQFVDVVYGQRFPGSKKERRTQSLQWPRFGAVDAAGDYVSSDEVPQEVKDAVCEAAIRELITPGSLNPDRSADASVIKRQMSKVGTLEKEIEYFENYSLKPVFSVIDDILAGLIGRASSIFRYGTRV